MLSFLRKIRKSLVTIGATRKYLLYAIGEIALVVIGPDIYRMRINSNLIYIILCNIKRAV